MNTQKNMQKTNELPFVEIIIVTWNKKKDIIKLLTQLQEISYPTKRYHTTVVDNHSTDGTCEEIKKKFPLLNLIESEKNLGGAGGFNTGMRWIINNSPEADFMWLLDNDVQIEKFTLKYLVKTMEIYQDAAVCGSRIMNIANQAELVEAGAFIDYKKGGIVRNLDTKGRQEKVFSVDYVAACSLLARVSAVKKMGLWHEKLFIYWDDLEWGVRFKKHGYKVLSSYESVAYHPSWRTRTFDNSATWRSYYRTRNSLWFFDGYTSGLHRLALLTIISIRATLLACKASFQANPYLADAYMNGISDFLNNQYGKKSFHYPDQSIDGVIKNKKFKTICIFLTRGKSHEPVKRLVSNLRKSNPNINLKIISPETRVISEEGLKPNSVHYYKTGTDVLSWIIEKLKIIKYLKTQQWNCLITSRVPPELGLIWGKEIAVIDFNKGHAFMINKIDPKLAVKMALQCLNNLIQLFFKMPASLPAESSADCVHH